MINDQSSSGSYYEVDFDPRSAMSLGHFLHGASEILSGVIRRLPVVRYEQDPNGFDILEEAVFVGPGEPALNYLIEIIEGEVAVLNQELDPGIGFEIYLTNANFREAAKHVLFRLRPKDGREGSVFYGIRVQRVGLDEFAVWSDL